MRAQSLPPVSTPPSATSLRRNDLRGGAGIIGTPFFCCNPGCDWILRGGAGIIGQVSPTRHDMPILATLRMMPAEFCVLGGR